MRGRLDPEGAGHATRRSSRRRAGRDPCSGRRAPARASGALSASVSASRSQVRRRAAIAAVEKAGGRITLAERRRTSADDTGEVIGDASPDNGVGAGSRRVTHGLSRRTTRGSQFNFANARQGDRAQEAPLVHPRRARSSIGSAPTSRFPGIDPTVLVRHRAASSRAAFSASSTCSPAARWGA